jgi:antitoxin (DNA-binding transcriptional repressor) of toxin-antitoxin stability system
MRSVGLKALKNKLSEYVRLAASGETVLISDRDRVVAELVPPRETRSGSLPDAILADAVRRGLLTPATLPPGPPPETTPVASLGEILAELADDRADR